VQAAFFEESFLDTVFDVFAKEGAVGQHESGRTAGHWASFGWRGY
jgi:hypothetical protein